MKTYLKCHFLCEAFPGLPPPTQLFQADLIFLLLCPCSILFIPQYWNWSHCDLVICMSIFSTTLVNSSKAIIGLILCNWKSALHIIVNLQMFITWLNECFWIAGTLAGLRSRMIEIGSRKAILYYQVFYFSQFRIVTRAKLPTLRFCCMMRRIYQCCWNLLQLHIIREATYAYSL